MKLYISCVLLFISLNITAQPVINAVTPQTATPGTIVTITGSNFSTSTTANIVSFGGVNATVNSATTNSLTVTVPVSASSPVSVTVAGLTAHSPFAFLPSFPQGGLYTGSFVVNATLDNNPGSSTHGLITADFDGDGKRDVCAVDWSTKFIDIYRNTTVNRSTSFAPRVSYATAAGPYYPVVADIDGDGKQDIIVNNGSSASISVFRNTSTAGVISFAAKADFTVGNSPTNLDVADLDKDGKPDIVTLNTQSLGSVSILRNTSTTGSVSFATKADITLGNGVGEVKLADLDGDAKAEIVIASGTLNTVITLRNISTAGAIAFSASQSFATAGSSPEELAIADLNADGKLDVVTGNYNSANISVFSNTSVSGNISFGAAQLFNCGASPTDVEISDLDGDGKPDVAVVRAYAAIATLKNSSAGVAIGFASAVSYSASGAFGNMCIGDVDVDNKPDIIIATGSLRGVVYINRSNEPQITNISPNPAAAGASVSISGYNFTGATQVKFGSLSASSFTVNNSNSITAVVGTGTSGDVLVETPNGTGIKTGFVFAGPPVITSFTPTSGGYGTEITINGHNFTSINSVTVGGVTPSNINPVSPSVIKVNVANGASGSVAVNTTYGTATLAGFNYTPVPAIFTFAPISGGMGTMVTITGRDFIGVTAVQFGGVAAASYTVVNSTTITAIIGNGSSGQVSVSTNYGTSQMAGFTFIPPPLISSFTPTSAGPNMIVTITGTGFNNATSVTFGGVAGYSVNVVSPTTITARVNTGASGNVIVTTPAGSSSLAGFTFVPAPSITSFTNRSGPGGKVLIKGSNFNFTQSIMLGGTPVTSFSIINSNTLEAIVGTGGSGDLVVTTSGGTATAQGFTYTSLPVINSFIPASGPVGTTVMIEGANFNTNPVLNTVYFGSVKAIVAAATANTITVTVPAGASSQQVTVTTNNLTAQSLKPFVITFAGGGAFTASSFSGRSDFNTPAGPGSLAAGDLDGDGKNDVVVANRTAGTIAVYLNNTVSASTLTMSGSIGFAAGINPNSVKLADIDVDGKLDVVLLNSSGVTNAVSIFRNTSSLGNLSFETRIEIPAEFFPGGLAIADLDVDGRPDLALAHYGYAWMNHEIITTYKNTSTPGNISFGQLQRFQVEPLHGSSFSHLTDIVAADLNNDYKPDLVVASEGYLLALIVNQSGNGIIHMTSSPLCNGCAFSYSENPAVADFNGDGGYDIITNRQNYTHTGGFSFNASATQMVGKKAVGNLSGNIQPDIVRVSSGPSGSLVMTHRNISATGISFEAPVSYSTGTDPWQVIVADFNNDGRPDVATANMGANTFTILLNGHGQPMPVTFGTFQARAIDSKVKLTWDVYTEVNVQGYEVERSANGMQFTTLTSVMAQNLSSYFAYDLYPSSGNNYYRIKAVDVDGRIGYSSLVKLYFGNQEANFVLRPNPLKGKRLNIILNDLVDDVYSLSITNALGAKEYSKALGRITGSMNTSIELPAQFRPGIYFITLKGSRFYTTRKLVVE